MAFETTMTVPTASLPELARRLKKAGFQLLDTGERVASDDGPDAEATVRLVEVSRVEYDPEAVIEMGISA